MSLDNVSTNDNAEANSMAGPPERGWKWIPLWDPNQDPAARETDVISFVNRVINHRSRWRRWQMQRMALNIWFDMGRQWIEPIHRLFADGNSGYHFREIYKNSLTAFPRPVTNLIKGYRINEVARLGKRELVPATYPDRQVSDLAEAAALAKDVLTYNLKNFKWADKREQAGTILTLTGTVVMSSYYDETVTSTMPIASPDAVICPSCGNKFASANIPNVYRQMGIPGPEGAIPFPHAETLQDVEGKPEVTMKHCPVCPQPSELTPSTPSKADVVQGQPDFFDRPLGEMLPKGEMCMDIRTPFETFPENGGIDVEPGDCKLWGFRKVRDLDYLASRYPGLADTLHGEDPIELLRYHPTMGEQMFTFGGYSAVGETDVYPNHAAELQVIVEPIDVPGLEQGRHFVVINDRVAFDDVLTAEIPLPYGGTKTIPRAQNSAARYIRVPGEFWGRTPIDDGISIQRRLNEIDSQIMDIRERFAPTLFLPEGVSKIGRASC